MAMRGRGLAAVATAGLGGCLGGPAPTPGAAVAPAPAIAAAPLPAPLAWPEAADCRALAAALLAMPEAERARLRPEGAPLALAVADGPALLPAAEVAGAIEVDLPVRAVERADGEPCLVVAGRPRVVPGGGRRLVAHEVVRSEYRTGSRRRINPDYQAAGDPDGHAEDDRVAATGDPALDLVGLVAGSVIRGLGRLGPGRGRPGETSGAADRYLEQAVFEPYTYQLSSFEVGRVGTMDAALADRRAGTALEVAHTISERRVFPVASGRHRADRGLLEGGGPAGVLPEDVALFEAAPPRPRLSDLLRAILDGGGEGRAANVEEVLARLGTGTPAVAASAAPSVPAGVGRRVTVETLAGPAEGEWLDEERIAVPAAALGRSSLVQVTGPDGMRVFGLVERVDREAGRAVVRVGRPGTARKLSDEGLEAVLRDLKSSPGAR
jgi:hypothetical protein